MPFSINRIASSDDFLKRPRVSYKISEYVWEVINEKILNPLNILQSDKYIYGFTLSFSFGIPVNHRVLYKSPYATDKRLHVPHKGFRTFEKTTKNAHLTVIADDVNQEIQPKEYAFLVFYMFADYLLYNYKKLNKELFDKTEEHIDISIVNSFSYPAPFDQQKYIADNSSPLIKDKYLNHYKM
jgi:hypothetical protein